MCPNQRTSAFPWHGVAASPVFGCGRGRADGHTANASRGRLAHGPDHGRLRLRRCPPYRQGTARPGGHLSLSGLPQAPRRPVFAAAIFPHEAVKITGETQDYAGRHICSICGSSVFAVSNGEVEIHLGAFDEPGQFTPTYELWTIRREPWLPAFPGMTQYARGRDIPTSEET